MTTDQIITLHKAARIESKDFRERRFAQWNENYLLYRDKVITNRLTQRQAVNIPIIRETIQTWISKIDEPPLLNFECRGRQIKDRKGEIILDELWSYYFDKLKLDVLDNLDKKIVGLQGRSFKKMGFAKGEFFIDLIDPYDIELDPKTNPLDLNSAQYIIHTNIFRPLRVILSNPKYDATAMQGLKVYLDSKQGLIKCADTFEAYEEKQERLRTLGATNYDEYNASDVMVELNEEYRLVWDAKEKKYVRHLMIIAADYTVLYDKPVKDAIGIDRLPFVTWADDPDLSDMWCDGKADSVRTINKIVNIYFSQDLENRTYRNFGMYFFNTMDGKFSPQAFDPKPFGMYGVPGNPDEIVKQMRIEPLPDTANQIDFLKTMIQSSVAQTPTERGVTTGQSTLGEVQINLQQSQGRNISTAKQYRRAWKEVGELFYELINANQRNSVKLYKKGVNGEYYTRTVMPKDWISPEGYECKVVIKSEKEANDQFALQKATYVINNFENNPVAQKIAKKKQLETLGWSPEEVQEAMAFEENTGQAPVPTDIMPVEGEEVPQLA